jgi:hypothetical protein
MKDKDEEKAKEIARGFGKETAIFAFSAAISMAQWKNEKIEKLKSLADEMYFRMQTLSTDLRPLRKAMEDYHNFIIHEYDE